MNDDRNKFTFTMQNGEFQNTMTFRADTWCEALENFEDFMRGCGYVFTGNFDLVDEEVFEVNEPEPLWADDPNFDKEDWETEEIFIDDNMNQQHPGVTLMRDERWPFPSDQK